MGCNAQRPKRDLVRVVRSPEGEISIDLRGKAPGRGAYLCPSAACLAKARKAKRLERTFEVPIPDGIYDRLTEESACAEQSAKVAASHEYRAAPAAGCTGTVPQGWQAAARAAPCKAPADRSDSGRRMR